MVYLKFGQAPQTHRTESEDKKRNNINEPEMLTTENEYFSDYFPMMKFCIHWTHDIQSIWEKLLH